GRSFFLVALAAQLRDDAADLVQVLIADALAAAVAALEAVVDVLPHLQRRLKAARPLAAALELPLEPPLAGEFPGAQEAALAALGVHIGPLDLHRHDDQPPPRRRSSQVCKSDGSGISHPNGSPVTGCTNPSSAACSA